VAERFPPIEEDATVTTSTRCFVATSFVLFAMALPVAGQRLPDTGEVARIVSDRSFVDRPAWQREPDKVSERGYRFILPYFEVNTADPSGRTTLLAVRNLSLGETESVTVTVVSQPSALAAPVMTAQVWTLAPAQTRTSNLRDWGLPSASGLARGYVIVEGPAPASAFGFAADYFYVEPADDFASGGLLEPFDDRCDLVHLRFGLGGAFDSTFLNFTIENPETIFSPTPRTTFSLTVYDEAGINWGTVEVSAIVVGGSLNLATTLASLPFVPTFGVIEVEPAADQDFAFFSTTFKAGGRYAVTLPGTCVFDVAQAP
jgi:hypothetical protein